MLLIIPIQLNSRRKSLGMLVIFFVLIYYAFLIIVVDSHHFPPQTIQSGGSQPFQRLPQ